MTSYIAQCDQYQLCVKHSLDNVIWRRLKNILGVFSGITNLKTCGKHCIIRKQICLVFLLSFWKNVLRPEYLAFLQNTPFISVWFLISVCLCKLILYIKRAYASLFLYVYVSLYLCLSLCVSLCMSLYEF